MAAWVMGKLMAALVGLPLLAGVAQAEIAALQDDPPHRPRRRAFYAGQQLGLGGQPAAAVMAHAG
jgi:hypothetical protein